MPPSVAIPTSVLIAPDSFKGTFTAVEVASAAGRGLRAAGRDVDLCPVADGGEGTLAALMTAPEGETGLTRIGEAGETRLATVSGDTRLATVSGDTRLATVSDPLGRPVEAPFGLRGQTGIVETAAASGLGLIAASERDAVAASTFGTGELILAAVAAGARRVYLGVGGSATTDGGAGAVKAIRAGGGLAGARLVVLCDVRTPFEDAARVFGPQKGAGPEQVRRLTRRLQSLARRLPRDPRGVPMTGAAGGLAGGLWAAFGAELVPGAAFVLDAVGFDARMRRARAVVTGEGKLDSQSLVGKVVSEVATRARQAGVPCHAIVGTRELDDFGARILDLQAVLEASTLEEIEDAGRRLAELI